jgi:hypothetical protein
MVRWSLFLNILVHLSMVNGDTLEILVANWTQLLACDAFFFG